ncbi:MAG: sulfatase [Planctomycetota bacterium]|nr:MAG: sulfatase [Planctomycetota bacterium]
MIRVVSLVLLWLASTNLVAAERPNVVLIVADDLGAMDLGCYGSNFHRTPHLDKLAAEGMRFTQSYSACPVCSPSRAAIVTGRYPQRFQLTDWLPGRPDRPDQRLNRPTLRNHLPLEAVTIADLLKPAGYVCGSIGKWHLGGEGFEPTKQGFDLNIAGDAAGSPQSYFAPFSKPNGKATPGLNDAPEGEYLPDRLTTEAEKFITANRERPFFLYLPHFTPHTPLKAKQELVKKYPSASTFRGQQNNPIYAAMLESLDESVGRIVAKLDELKLSDRTIVLFTSDNGGLATTEGPNTPATSNAPLREGKGWLYEGGIRVPLLVKWPGNVKANSTSDVPVCGIDLMPTIRDACVLESTKSIPTDGVSLLPLLKHSGTIARESLFWHYPHYANQGGKPGGVVRSGEWKLVEFYEEGRRELFHVAKDVSESRNLAEQESDRVRDLSEKLAAWRKSVGALMPEPNPNYTPNPQSDNGEIVIPARTADVRGTMLRYEPMPHKNTIGFWVRTEDWARFEFTVTKPGKFELEGLIGCGNGSGGSDVRFEIAPSGSEATPQTLSYVVKETGGFQAFVPTPLGEVTLDKPGRYELRVKAIKKPNVAVMDMRQARLIPK